MEWGESPVETAVRELQEETGLSVTIGPVLGVFSRWYPDGESVRGEPGHVIGIVYGATDVAGAVRPTFDEGTTDVAQWFELDEIQHLRRVELLDFVLGLI